MYNCAKINIYILNATQQYNVMESRNLIRYNIPLRLLVTLCNCVDYNLILNKLVNIQLYFLL